jgi:hypothetical protein
LLRQGVAETTKRAPRSPASGAWEIRPQRHVYCGAYHTRFEFRVSCFVLKMTGKAYYITTLGDWQRHAARFANSHFIVLDPGAANDVVIPSEPAVAAGDEGSAVALRALHEEMEQQIPRTDQSTIGTRKESEGCLALTDNSRILVLIEADEGVHLSLDDDPAFQSLPHPLAQKPISDSAQSALAPHGVAPGATTFDSAETLSRIHPLLKHRVF